MEARSLQYVAEACGAEVLSGALATPLQRVCTDSRHALPGDVFFALPGDRFDGHAYASEAARKGVAAVVVQRDRPLPREGLAPSLGILAVESTRRAIGALAARYREDFRLAVIAVAGSNGKTTTKELLASVLRQRFSTLWSEASFNNDIGVPLTLLRLERPQRMAVFEVGTNHPGELAPLVRMVQPQFGVLTNIGREHLEFFGDLAGVAREEAALAEGLPPFGKLWLNGDDAWSAWIGQRASASVVTVGLGAANDWRARNIRVGEDGVTFEVSAPQSEYSGDYALQLLGRHQVSNALLALAAGTELGVSPEEAHRGLAACASVKHRLQVKDCRGICVLNDAYNANADSMLAALQTLRDFPCSGRRWAVLGDMAELGANAAQAHREVGQRTAELGVERLIAVGTWARHTTEAARAAGLSEALVCDDVSAAAGALRAQVKPGDVVLLKASRVAGLERLENELGCGRPEVAVA